MGEIKKKKMGEITACLFNGKDLSFEEESDVVRKKGGYGWTLKYALFSLALLWLIRSLLGGKTMSCIPQGGGCLLCDQIAVVTGHRPRGECSGQWGSEPLKSQCWP